MAVPSSGELELYGDIGTELGVAQSNVTLHGMSQTAGFTEPDAMSEFYGYDPTPPLTTSFNTVLYTGVSGTDSITGVGFQPDLVWVKNRTTAVSNVLFDSVRGSNKTLYSDLTNSEDTQPSGAQSFLPDGFSFSGEWPPTDAVGNNYVMWCWKAGGPAVTNTAGSITSQVSANVAAGFSIVTCTATDSVNTVDTIGHGLGVAPSLIIYKTRSTTGNWSTYHQSLGNTKGVYLNTTSAVVTSTFFWNNTSPTSDVFTAYGSAGNTHIAYCFAEVAGFSKFGTYEGTGVAGQSITGLGFAPALVIIKNVDDGTTVWRMWDNKRPVGALLSPSISQEEQLVTSVRLDLDGFTLQSVNTQWNNASRTFIYMAFANQF